MAYIVKMPKLGMQMDQGILLEWYISVGETVTEDAPIAEVESEKSVAEIAASEDGALRRIYVSEGESVEPGTPLAIVAEPEESITDIESKIDLDPVEGAAEAGTTTETTTDAGTAESNEEETSGVTDGTSGIRASPKAKKRADELNVDLEDVSGSGPRGEIVSADVEEAKAVPTRESASDGSSGSRSQNGELKATPKAKKRVRNLDIDLADVEGSGPKGAVTCRDIEAAVEVATTGPTDEERTTETDAAAERNPVEERSLSGMRQTIADRLGQSYREAVHVTVNREIDMEEALAATEVVDSYLEHSASVTDVVLVALSATLDDHPEFNATFEDGIHSIHEQQNIGIAVDIDDGLLTPVLSAANDRSLRDLVRERREITDRALSNEYTTTDLSGGTFTVTNLGMFGVDSFTPIINPPEVAILGISRIRERPVRTDDGVGFRKVGSFDLAFDHRVLDGADAARFLDTFSAHLTDPWPNLLDRS